MYLVHRMAVMARYVSSLRCISHRHDLTDHLAPAVGFTTIWIDVEGLYASQAASIGSRISRRSVLLSPVAFCIMLLFK